MKNRIWICVVLLALLLSLCSVTAAAEELPDVQWVTGRYAGGSAESFAPLGDVTIQWIPDMQERVDLADGDLSDWYALDVAGCTVTPNNMIEWTTDKSGTFDGWGMTAYFAADPDGLYMAFDITDADFTYAQNPNTYDGDAIQLSLDLGEQLREVLEKDPDIMTSKKSIFYSFACFEDGAPIRVMRQESDQDRVLSETNGDGVQGMAKKTAKGWSAELFMEWQLLVDDFRFKSWDDSGIIYVGSEERIPLTLGLTLSYINRTASGTTAKWAAATARGWTDPDGTPLVSWTPYDNGATLVLPWEEGMKFNCSGFFPINVDGYITVARTESPVEPDTVTPVDTLPPEVNVYPSIGTPPSETIPVWEETTPELEETARDAAEEMDRAAELNAFLEKYGCGASVGMGGLTLLAGLAMAAFTLRKKD